MSLPFTPDDLPSFRLLLEKTFPHVSVNLCTLGGEHRASISVHATLDPREEWRYGIFHNSRHVIAMIDHEGTLTGLAYGGAAKIRKTRRAVVASNFEKALETLKRWADAVQAGGAQ